MSARLYACDTCGRAWLYLMQPWCECGGEINPTPYIVQEGEPTAEELAAEGDQLVREINDALSHLEGDTDEKD